MLSTGFNVVVFTGWLHQLPRSSKTLSPTGLVKCFNFLSPFFLWRRRRCFAGDHLRGHAVYTCGSQRQKLEATWHGKYWQVGCLLFGPNSFRHAKGCKIAELIPRISVQSKRVEPLIFSSVLGAWNLQF